MEESFGEVKINTGIFQGEFLSPLLLVISLIPLTNILRNSKLGYKCAYNGEKINHLYRDDLKLCCKNEKELDSLTQIFRVFSQDIQMEFGIDKRAVLVMKRGRMVKSDGIKFQMSKL